MIKGSWIVGACLFLTANGAFAQNLVAADERTSEQSTAPREAQPLTAFEETELNHFAPLTPDQLQSASIPSYIDPNHEVSRPLLEKALAYAHANAHLLGNSNYLGVVNFSARSTQKRFFIVNVNTGLVWGLHVAHGRGSDPANTGLATRFSNVNDSEMSSLGYYRTGEVYSGEHGRSLRLDGLSSTNSNVRSRAIVVHGADYVHDASVVQGRSWGCFAVPMADRDRVVELLKGGSIIYAGLAR